jgi:hypothetical protein
MSILGFRIMHNHDPYISLTPVFNIVCIFLMCSQYFERDTLLKGDNKKKHKGQAIFCGNFKDNSSPNCRRCPTSPSRGQPLVSQPHSSFS